MSHWSLSPSTPPSNEPIRWPTSDDVQQGCILWLSTADDTISTLGDGHPWPCVINVNNGKIANDGMYNHPILVVSRPAKDPAKIKFLPMTSLNNQCLDERFKGRKSSYHQNTFVPIQPAKNHPQAAEDGRYRTLSFENGEALEKATYVNVRELYEMPWHAAELYWGGEKSERKKWKLDNKSIRSLLKLLGSTVGLKHEGQHGKVALRSTWPMMNSPTPRLNRAPTGSSNAINPAVLVGMDNPRNCPQPRIHSPRRQATIATVAVPSNERYESYPPPRRHATTTTISTNYTNSYDDFPPLNRAATINTSSNTFFSSDNT